MREESSSSRRWNCFPQITGVYTHGSLTHGNPLSQTVVKVLLLPGPDCAGLHTGLSHNLSKQKHIPQQWIIYDNYLQRKSLVQYGNQFYSVKNMSHAKVPWLIVLCLPQRSLLCRRFNLEIPFPLPFFPALLHYPVWNLTSWSELLQMKTARDDSGAS